MNDLPLVLIHGYPFDHTLWFSTIAALGNQARVICPDLPGFGREPVLESDPSMAGYAEYIARILDKNEVSRAVLAGMSMGGYVALAFADRYPKRLAGLGLISTQSAADSNEVREARREMIKKIKKEGVRPAIEAVLPKLFSARASENPDLVEYPKKGAEKAGVEGISWALGAMAERPDRTSLVEDLNVPVLFVHGSEDKIVPIARISQQAQIARKPIWLNLPGVGHASPLEAPDQVARGLAQLMKAVRQEAA